MRLRKILSTDGVQSQNAAVERPKSRPSALFSAFNSRLLAAFILAGIFLSSTLSYAQGCAMCANNASALKAGALAALRSGILILLIPSALMFIIIFAFAFRRRERFNEENPLEAGLDVEPNQWLTFR